MENKDYPLLETFISDTDIERFPKLRKNLFVALAREEGLEQFGNIIIPKNGEILKNQGIVSPDLGIVALLSKLESIPVNKDWKIAVNTIAAFNNRKKGTNPIMIGKINHKEYKNPKQFLEACTRYYYERYGVVADVVGEYGGKDGKRVKVETPYGEFTQFNWNLSAAPAGSKPGDIHIKQEGVMIGEKVRDWHEQRECIVIDAGHEHGSQGQGTRSIIVQYDDGTVVKKTPRSLEPQARTIITN